MTGPEHYVAAEKLLAEASDPDFYATDIATAQVHATLALAAATALNDSDGGAPVEDFRAWKAVASEEPPRS